MVFTHGATVDHHEWDATLPIVGKDFQVLVWDVRGHGLSRPAPFSLKESLKDLTEILDILKVEEAIFVGHSLGGNLHQELVFHHPERLKALVFLDCTWNFQKLSTLESLSLSVAEPLLKLYPHKSLINQSLAVTATSKKSQDLLRPAMDSLKKDEMIQILMDSTVSLHNEPGYNINKSILMMVGDKDTTVNIRKIMPIFAKNETECRFVVIPNAKHAANLDNPEFFHRILMEFLSKFLF